MRLQTASASSLSVAPVKAWTPGIRPSAPIALGAATTGRPFAIASATLRGVPVSVDESYANTRAAARRYNGSRSSTTPRTRTSLPDQRWTSLGSSPRPTSVTVAAGAHCFTSGSTPSTRRRAATSLGHQPNPATSNNSESRGSEAAGKVCGTFTPLGTRTIRLPGACLPK